MSAQVIAHPALLAQKRRQKALRKKKEQKLLACTTRYLKYLITVLDLMLAFPKDHPLGPRSFEERKGMGERLTMYRNELQRRDQRRDEQNAQLEAQRLSQRVNQLQHKFRKAG